MKDPIRLLHLDDDATERAELGRLARDQNPPWSITPAGGLAEARALLAVESFDVIVTEARLPDGATFELFPDGNAAAGRTMLLVTGRGDEGTAARALEAGFSGYVVKRAGREHLAELPGRIAAALAARAEQRTLRETAARLSDLFDGTSEIIQSVDPQGRIQYVNRRWRETFGYGDEEIAGINLFNLIHPEEQAHCGMLFQRLMSGEDIGEIETRLVARDGRSVVLRGRATVRFEQGRPIATRTVLRDVTAQRRAEEIERRRSERVLRLQSNLLLLRERSDGELEEYLDLVARSTRESVGLSVSSVWMLSPDGVVLECRSRRRETAPGGARVARPADPGPVLAAINGEFPVAVNRLADSPALAGLAGTDFLPAETTGAIVAPVMLQGRPAGYVVFAREAEGTEWEAEEVRFAAAAAACVVLAFERERRRRAEEANRALRQNLERLVAERTIELAESERRFRQLADNIGDVFYTIELATGRFLYVSPAFAKVWGRPEDHLWASDEAWLEAVHEEDRAAARDFADRRGAGPAELEYRIRRPDGVIRRVQDRSFPVCDAAGAVYRAAGLAVDVTERRNAEAGRMQRQRLEAIGNLASGIAHDLNNTLTPITLGLQLLRRKHPGEDEIYGRLLKSAAHGSNVIRQLLTFARGAGGERTLVRSGEILANLAALVGATFPRNIRVQTRCAPDTRPVLGDFTQLQQVLLNLCVNSRDAMPDGGSLEIEAGNLLVDAAYAAGAAEARPGHYVVWRVQDSGVGIPKGIIGQIFEPFFSTKGPEPGTGLGLSTLAGIVREHGGFVTVSSEPHRGACFRVHLPAAAAELETGSQPAATSVSPAAAPAASGAGRHILVVDDEALVLETLCATLQGMGYRTSAAADGTEALIRAAEERAGLHALVTDIHMSGVDGLKLIRTLRHMLPRLPIVVVSGRVDTAQQRELAQAGVAQIILKPFTEEQLAAALEGALAGPQG